jgi:hypothetical protein
VSQVGEESGVFEEELFENERFQPFRGFGSNFPGHLLPTDRNKWSDRSGSLIPRYNPKNPNQVHPHPPGPATHISKKIRLKQNHLNRSS